MYVPETFGMTAAAIQIGQERYRSEPTKDGLGHTPVHRDH